MGGHTRRAFHILLETPIPAASSRTPDCSPRQAQIWDHKQTAPERPKSGSDGNSPIRFHPMGWRWHDDDGDSGRGLGGVPDLAGGGGDGAQCATRRVVQSRCHTEEVEPGRFVRKCEKTEQLLRDCVGRYSLCLVLSLNPLTWRLIGGDCDLRVVLSLVRLTAGDGYGFGLLVKLAFAANFTLLYL